MIRQSGKPASGPDHVHSQPLPDWKDEVAMIGAVARKLFGSSNDRRIRTYRPRVDAINALEQELEQLSDQALRARTEDFKKRLAEGATLDDVLVPAFATVREASKRT